MITQADASSQVVLKDAASSPVCMEEDQYQLEELDAESVEERLRPSMGVKGSAVKTPKDKANNNFFNNNVQAKALQDFK